MYKFIITTQEVFIPWFKFSRDKTACLLAAQGNYVNILSLADNVLYLFSKAHQRLTHSDFDRQSVRQFAVFAIYFFDPGFEAVTAAWVFDADKTNMAPKIIRPVRREASYFLMIVA
jgi:hypothetical protein